MWGGKDADSRDRLVAYLDENCPWRRYRRLVDRLVASGSVPDLAAVQRLAKKATDKT